MNPQTSDEFLPFQARSFLLDGGESAHDYRLNYIDEGKGKALICVHGNPTWSFYFRNVIEHFREKMRVVAFDHLGCGLSDHPQDYSYTLSNHIKNFEALIEGLNIDKVSLLLHDWGGAIGLGFAVKHPEKVENVIVMNSAAFLSRDIPKRISACKTPVVGEMLMRRFNAFALAASFMATGKGLDPKVKKGLLFPYNNYRNRIGIARFVQDIPYFSSHPSYETVRSIELGLGNLQAPMQLLWGAKDFCFHLGFLEKWKTLFPRAKSIVFPEGGHYLLEDETQAVLAAMERFLVKDEYCRTH
ncbi:MAG: alpha/beta fold hydrolase [Oligoflexales bacterium]